MFTHRHRDPRGRSLLRVAAAYTGYHSSSAMIAFNASTGLATAAGVVNVAPYLDLQDLIDSA